MKRQVKNFVVALAFDEMTKALKWRQYMAHSQLNKSDRALAVERLRSSKRIHLLLDVPAEYKAVEWEVVSSRRNKDGTLTQRLRPTRAVQVFKPTEEKAS